MQIIIKTEVFAAVALFRAIKDIRYYICGLYLQTGRNGARLVATDGHQIAVAKIEYKDWPFPATNIIIPNVLADAVKYSKKNPQYITISFEGIYEVGKPREITLEYGDQKLSAKEIDGTFPDYQRHFPNKVTGEIAQFEPALISRIDKASTILGNRYFSGIAHNGTTGLSVVKEDFVVMTGNLKVDPDPVCPDWVKEPVNLRVNFLVEEEIAA